MKQTLSALLRCTLFPRSMILGAVVFAVCSAGPLAAGDVTVSLDADRTEVTFTLEATGHTVNGVLHLRQGEVVLGGAGKASGDLVIDAVKTDTGSKRRDKAMHKKVLESAAHPLIVFHVESYEGELPAAGSGEMILKGSMELLGKPHPMEMPIQVERDGSSFHGKARFPVPFVEWGLHDPSLLFLRVEKVVTVSVETAGSLQTLSSVTAEPAS